MHFPEDNPAWRETNVETPILKLSSAICWKASTGIRFASLALIFPKVGFATSPKKIARKLRQRCADERHELPDSLHQFVEGAAQEYKACQCNQVPPIP